MNQGPPGVPAVLSILRWALAAAPPADMTTAAFGGSIVRLASVRNRASCAIAGLLALVWVMYPSVLSADTGAIVETQTGKVQGVAEHGVLAFKGIPYAAPPVGNLRWRAPEAPAAWDGARDGSTYGRGCIAVPDVPSDVGGDPGPHSEDCLYLNVWTPSTDPTAKLPVMVWIHGGAYVFGSGSLDLYTGAPLAKRGAVVVSLNYRLMQLGFFVHPALEMENPGGPANFGLLDQIAALKWVKAEIARFGGDPGNVTIFGQSAGGRSVLALVASPLARGLFHKAISQSSYILPDATRTKARAAGTKTAEALGLPGAKATAAELRGVPAGRFAVLKGTDLSNSPVPIAGDPVLPQSIQATFAAGKEARVPLILGTTSDDISVAAAFGVDPAAVVKRLGAAGFLLRVLYPGIADKNELARQAARDVVFTMPVRWIADRHAARAPTWRYYFNYVTLNDRAKYSKGVPHGADVPYVLDTLDLFSATKPVAVDRDRSVARSMADYWFEFARTGTPAAQDGPVWTSHARRRDRTLVIGDTFEVQRNFMRARLDVMLAIAGIADRFVVRH